MPYGVFNALAEERGAGLDRAAATAQRSARATARLAADTKGNARLRPRLSARLLLGFRAGICSAAGSPQRPTTAACLPRRYSYRQRLGHAALRSRELRHAG
jgi:hypothetical protein